jgi:hypothetical protein
MKRGQKRRESSTHFHLWRLGAVHGPNQGTGCIRVQQMMYPGVFFTQMNMILLQWYDMKETTKC